MLAFVQAFLAKLALGVLDKLIARHDLKESVRKTIALRSEKHAKEAYKVKADNPVDLSDPTGDFRMRKP